MSRYPGDKEINRGVESFLLIGDPVLVNNSKDGPIIANIAKITKSNQVLKQIDISSDNQIKDVELTLRQIETEVIDGKLFWRGTTSSDTFKCIGDNCLPIRPSIELNPPEGMTKYVFDISLMRDMGVHLKLSTPPSQETECASSASSIIKKKCYKCKLYILLIDTRCHIAQHILKAELFGVNVCGFCGRDSCSVTLKKSPKKGGQEFFGIDKCDCIYFYQYSRSKKFNKKTNPCTNRIERCSIKGCLSNVWLYNFEHHFEENHQNKEYPTNMVIDEAERRHLLNL